MLPKSPTYRSKCQASTRRLAFNERRTDEERHAERTVKTARTFDWRCLQNIINLNTDNRLERSRIGRGVVEIPHNFRRDS